MGLKQVQPVWTRKGLNVIVMIGYSPFPKHQNYSFTMKCSLMSDLGHKMVSSIAIKAPLKGATRKWLRLRSKELGVTRRVI